MNKAKRDGTGIPIRVYRPNLFAVLAPIMIAFVVFFSCGGLPLYFALVNRYTTLVSGNYNQYYFIILVFMLFFVYLAYMRHYLAIYENGIMLSSPLKKVFSSWENLKALEVAKSEKGSPLNYYLVTHEPVDQQVKKGTNEISLAKYSSISLTMITKADYKRLVPQGQLGKDLQHYAPQLFE